MVVTPGEIGLASSPRLTLEGCPSRRLFFFPRELLFKGSMQDMKGRRLGAKALVMRLESQHHSSSFW